MIFPSFTDPFGEQFFCKTNLLTFYLYFLKKAYFLSIVLICFILQPFQNILMYFGATI